MDDLQRELDAVEKRTRRYWFEDGIAETCLGAVFLLVAVYFLLQHALRGTGRERVLDVAFPALIVVLAVAGRWMIRAAKDRFVHPRTGFVSFRRTRRHRWTSAALALVIGALVALLLSRSPLLRSWVPALEGTVFAVGFLSIGRRVEILRFPVEGLLCAALGIVVSVIGLDEDLAAALLFAWLGAGLATGGLLAFVGYLRRVPPREEA